MLDNVFVSQYLDGAEMLLDLKVPASLVGEYYLSKTYCGHILNIYKCSLIFTVVGLKPFYSILMRM